MFDFFRRELRLLALRRSLKKKGPSRFTYRNDIDYYFPRLINQTGEKRVSIEKLTPCFAIGRTWREDHLEKSETKVPLSDLHKWNIEISRVYGFLRWDYSSDWSFWSLELTFGMERAHIWEKFSQTLYNRNLRARNSRIETLTKIVELQKNKVANEFGSAFFERNSFSFLSIAEEIYGWRIHQHPDRKRILIDLRITVESLVSSGDFQKNRNSEYQISPKALKTISDFALDEQRHKDSFRLSKGMFLATFVIAVATLFQAYVAASSSENFKAWFPPSFPEFSSSEN